MKRRPLTAITGGIGAGKSVVSAVLRAMGYEVLDCDAEARRIMDCDEEIHRRLCREIDCRAVVGGVVDRRLISEIVFSDRSKLEALNRIVHGAVRECVERRAACGRGVLFFETAILYQSGFDSLADEVWEVTAPVETRVARVMARSGLTREQVKARIEAQALTPERNHCNTKTIVNDGRAALLPQILAIIDS